MKFIRELCAPLAHRCGMVREEGIEPSIAVNATISIVTPKNCLSVDKNILFSLKLSKLSSLVKFIPISQIARVLTHTAPSSEGKKVAMAKIFYFYFTHRNID